MWSMSQDRGWSGAPGEHAVVIDQLALDTESVRDLVGADVDVLGQVLDRPHGHLHVRARAPVADPVDPDRRTRVLDPGETSIDAVCPAGEGGVGEVDVEHDLGPRRRGLLLLSVSRIVVGEGGLAAGEVAGGDGAAYVVGLTAAGGSEGGGAAVEGVVEVEGVAQVEGAGEVDGAVDPDCPGVEGEVASVGGGAGAFLGLRGVEPGLGFLDEAADLREGHFVRDVGEVSVDVGRTGRGQARGVLGDELGPPERQVPGDQALPEAWEAVADLEDGPDVAFAGVGGDTQRGGDLEDCGLQHPRGTVTGEGDAVVPERRGTFVVGLVQDAPVHDGLDAAAISAWSRVFARSRTALSTVVLSSLPGWFAMSLLDQGPPTVGPLSAALVSSGETSTETFFELFSVRLDHRSAGCWSSPGSVSEPVSRPPWGGAAFRLARSRRGLAELGRLDHRQGRLAHRSFVRRSSPGSVSEPVSRPP